MPTSGGAPPHLPSLDNAGGVNSSHHSSRNGSSNTTDGSTSSGGHSASLRGHSFNRVPDICNQPLHTLLPVVKEGWLPPEPYYITQNVVLKVPDGRPPWADAFTSGGNFGTSSQMLVDMWEGNEKFRQQVLNELIKDCIHVEVAGIASATLAEHRAKNHEEAFLHAWLEDKVVTDTVYLATEDIVWEALWDQARKLKKRQMEDLEREMGRKKQVDNHMLSILRDNYTEPLNSHSGASVVNKKWSELLYHTNRYMQRGSLMENYAIRKLQEQIICQIAAKVVLDESVKCVEQELASLDQEFRIDRPPKIITQQGHQEVASAEAEAEFAD